jgi:hypothetical protein
MKSLKRLARKWNLFTTTRKVKKELTCAITCTGVEELTVYIEACKLTGHNIESTYDNGCYTLLMVSRSGKGANKKEIFEIAKRVGQARAILDRCESLKEHGKKSSLWDESCKFANWDESRFDEFFMGKKKEGAN